MANPNTLMPMNVDAGESEASKGRDRDTSVEILDEKLKGLELAKREGPPLGQPTNPGGDLRVLTSSSARLGGDTNVKGNDGTEGCNKIPMLRWVGNEMSFVWVPETTIH